MLNIVIDDDRMVKSGTIIYDPRDLFTDYKKPEWFEDEFVKRFLKEVDGSTVIFEEALKDKFGHGISTEMMSTGCKTLCVIYYGDDSFYYNGSAMGNNCVPFLIEIAKTRNINIFLRHYMEFIINGVDYFKTGLITMYGETIYDEDRYYDIVYNITDDEE